MKNFQERLKEVMKEGKSLKIGNLLKRQCKNCGKDLRPSQFARRKKEGAEALKDSEVLVCRNYPDCEKVEKEI